MTLKLVSDRADCLSCDEVVWHCVLGGFFFGLVLSSSSFGLCHHFVFLSSDDTKKKTSAAKEPPNAAWPQVISSPSSLSAANAPLEPAT